MVAVLGIIGSLTVVLVLIVLAVLVIAVAALATFAALAGSMADWQALWRRLTRGRARLTLKFSADTAPERLRAQLTGGIPGVRRRLHLGGARPRPHSPGADGSVGGGAGGGPRAHGRRTVRRSIGI
ncbi:hypothetical protein ABGB18_04625 [Nonomuraea sp. B12E4]|uniref:hypothetical protein n=1 Tax=Nonomuraea sp. B12E4 TaxID=3153564 RepID=UPI00325EE584